MHACMWSEHTGVLNDRHAGGRRIAAIFKGLRMRALCILTHG